MTLLIAAKLPANPTVRAFTNVYTADGKVDYQLDAQQNITNFTFGSTETTVSDPLTNATRYDFSGTNALPDYVEDANGSRTSYTYDAYQRVTGIRSPVGDVIEFTLDDRGNATSMVHKAQAGSGLGDLVSTAHFPICSDSNFRTCNKPDYVVDQRGGRSDYAYDAASGDLIVSIAPADTQGRRAVTRMGYGSFAPAVGTAPVPISGAEALTQANSILPTTVDQCLSTQPGVDASFVCPAADTVRTSYVYTASTSAAPGSHELQTVASDPDGANLVTRYTYDQVGNAIADDGPRSDADVTRYEYDASRRLRLVTSPTVAGVAPKTRYGYDLNGHVVTVERSLGAGWQTETVSYDVRGLAVQSIGADGAITSQSYDAAGRPFKTWKTVDGLIRRDRVELDAGGRQIGIRQGVGSPLEQVVSAATIWPNGLVQSQTDALGNVSTFCYDGYGRMIERRYPQPDTRDAPLCNLIGPGFPLPAGVTSERYVYAANGDLTSLILRDGSTVGLSYDGLGRLIGKDVPDVDRDVSYSYDLLGRRTAATLPGANAPLSVSWSYDKLNRIIASTGAYGRTVGYSYDPASTWMRVHTPDGSYATYDSDVLGRVTRISGLPGAAQPVLADIGYDELSRRTNLTFGNGGTGIQYGYNAQNRLGTLALDLAGSGNDVLYDFTYIEAAEIRSRNDSNTSYRWSAPGAAVRTYRPAVGSAATGGNGLNQYGRIDPNPNFLSYDLRGNLTQDSDPQRVWNASYDTENRLTGASGVLLAYDAVGRLASLTQGSVSTQFVYDGADLVAEYDASTGALVRRTVHGPAVDEPLVMYQGGVPTWLYADERGSIVALANAAGAGLVLNSYGPSGEPGANGTTGRFGFTGQVWMPELGLYHYKTRAYSPSLGRFLQPDPIGEAGGMNVYAYALNDPINLSDPNGLDPWSFSNSALQAAINQVNDIWVNQFGGTLTDGTIVIVGRPDPAQWAALGGNIGRLGGRIPETGAVAL